jgi:hypothetical protein
VEFVKVNSIPEICVTDLAINIYAAAQFYEVWLLNKETTFKNCSLNVVTLSTCYALSK